MARGMLLGILDGIGDIIGNIFQWLFDTILAPIISGILELLVTVIFNVVKYLFGYVFYTVSVFLLQLIDFVEIVFKKLAGISTTNEIVFKEGTSPIEGDLLIHFIRSSDVVNAFLACCIVGLFLLIIMTIFQMVKVEYTTEGAQNSKTSIIGKSLKSLSNLLLIPVLVIFGVIIGNSILGLINTATGGGSSAKISGVMWVTAASGALYDSASINDGVTLPKQLQEVEKTSDLFGQSITYAIRATFSDDDGNKAAGLPNFGGNNSNKEKIESAFMTHEKAYSDIGTVLKFYNVFEVNYLILIFGACIIIKCLFLSCFGLIDRLYQCLALFIVSPMVIGMSPVKDSLGSWRSKFIQKALSAYGVVISLNLFFIISGLFLNLNVEVDLSHNPVMLLPSSLLSGLIKCIFVIVGCLMIEKLAGDLGQYFGGGNAMAEGKGLASEAAKGLTTAAKVGVGVAMGGAGIAGKIGKGVGKVGKGIGATAKFVGNTRLGQGLKNSKFGQGISKTTSAVKSFGGKLSDKVKDSKVGRGVAKAGAAIGSVGKTFKTQGFAGLMASASDSMLKHRMEKEGITDDDLKGKTKDDFQSDIDQQKGIISDADAEIAAATEDLKNAHGNKQHKAARKRINDALRKKNAAQQQIHKDQSSMGLLAAQENNSTLNAWASDREKKIDTRNQHARDVVQTTFGGLKQMGKDAVSGMLPGPLSQFGKDWSAAVEKGNSYSDEGKAALGRLKKEKEDAAAEAYDNSMVNKPIIAATQNKQAQLIAMAYGERLTADVSNQNKLLQSIKDSILEAARIAKDKDKSDQERQLAVSTIQNAINQGKQINKDFGFDYTSETFVNANINLDVAAFKTQIEEAVKRGAKMDEIKRIMAEEFKKAGLTGGESAEKMLAEFKKVLEEIKGEIGK